MAAGVVDTSKSPEALLHPLPLSAVTIDGGFWRRWMGTNRSSSIPSQYSHIERTGRLDNFRRASGKIRGDFQGLVYNDSDVYKWMEAISFCIEQGRESELEALLDSVIEEVAAAQGPDGYLNTHFVFDREEDRWSDLPGKHEIYCGGHLIQAAIAHHRATGKTTLLDTAVRWSDLVCHTFSPAARKGVPGHEEVEMALIELYRETGRKRYLDAAKFFIDERRNGVDGGSGASNQAHKPVRQQHDVVGHAVRQMYLCCGVTDLYAETGEKALVDALDKQWHNFVERRMYITGGAGARYSGEAFGTDYELPNDTAYAETCAAIGSFMWNWRMLLVSGECRFADVMERAIYNGILSGMSLDGNTYFYTNPLEFRSPWNGGGSRKSGQRTDKHWDQTACCPPNVARLLASLPGYFYSVSDRGLWVHFFAPGTAAVTLPGGNAVRIVQATNYPWDGKVQMTVSVEQPGEFSVFVRIPSWAEGADCSVQVEGTSEKFDAVPGSYAEIRRVWSDGEVIELNLPMQVRRVVSHPCLAANAGRVALECGPILYCLEHADHPGTSVFDIVLPDGEPLVPREEPDLLGGTVTLRGTAFRIARTTFRGKLYSNLDAAAQDPQPVELKAIPYHLWANREPGEMCVWIRRQA